MALDVAPRRQRHGHGGQDDGQQRRQTEELLRPFERDTDLRPAVLRVFDPFAARQARLDLALEALHDLLVAGQQQAVADPATHLQQAGRRQIVEVHQQAWGNAEKIDTAIRFQRQHRIDTQQALADDHRIADACRQRRSQTLVDPDRADIRHAARRSVGHIQRRSRAQCPAQRITGLHRLDLGQLRAQVVACSARHHAREGPRLDHLQPARARIGGQFRRPRMIRRQQQVCTEQLVGLTVKRLANTVGEETDRRQRRHGHRQRRRQQP